MWQKHPKMVTVSEKDNLFQILIEEVNRSIPGAQLSFSLRNKLEKFPFEIRKEIVNRVKQGSSPLFRACKKGQFEIVQYLVNTCGAEIEEKGVYDVAEEDSTYIVTPLWCAAVSGKLEVVEFLVEAGANVNAVSDSGSTPIRSACFMTHSNVVEYLVKKGADVNRPNYNGGTCLINSVQSAPLCLFLLKNGADVNAKDMQNKTALHYAIQEHRLETTILLLSFGADFQAQSRYGGDALQMACLKGATTIFDFLIKNITYHPERIANAHELMGATFLDEHNDISVCLSHWRRALKIREEFKLNNKPEIVALKCYRYQKEFENEDELLAMDTDTLRIQSLLVAERILGPHHKDTIFRLMFRGASYADIARYQRCIDLWLRCLEIRIEKDTILFQDTCVTARALIKLMFNYHIDSIKHDKSWNINKRFDDIVATFRLLLASVEIRSILDIHPQHKRHLDNFEKILRCITHLMHLMIEVSTLINNNSETNHQLVDQLLIQLIRLDLRCFIDGNSLLHLYVDKLNSINSNYVMDEAPLIIFPKLSVLTRMLRAGANVNARNFNGASPLHIAVLSYNYSPQVVKILLNYGAHLDMPDSKGVTPLDTLKNSQISLVNYTNLKCLCASIIVKNHINYKGQLPKTLESFLRFHEPS